MSWLGDFFHWIFRPYHPPPPPPPPAGDFAAQVLSAMNAARAQAGLAPYRLDPRLGASAQREAECCALSGLDHFCGGTTPWERIAAAGYAWAAAGEGIAQGQRSAAEFVSDLLSDPPHRADVLGAYTDLGVGHAGDCWVTDYARPAGTRAAAVAVFSAPGGLVRRGGRVVPVGRQTP